MKLKKVPDPRKVMIVEDEQDLLILYKDYLEKKGCEVMTTSITADEILADYNPYQPDLLIMDYKLPGIRNGLQAARVILTAHSETKIIILTAFDKVSQELKNDTFFSDKNIKVLIKPIQLSQLKNLVTE